MLFKRRKKKGWRREELGKRGLESCKHKESLYCAGWCIPFHFTLLWWVDLAPSSGQLVVFRGYFIEVRDHVTLWFNVWWGERFNLYLWMFFNGFFFCYMIYVLLVSWVLPLLDAWSFFGLLCRSIVASSILKLVLAIFLREVLCVESCSLFG